MKRSFVLFGLCVVVSALCGVGSARAGGQPFTGKWQFSATIDTPSTTLDGRLNIILDSAGIVIGAVKLDRHVIPFRGRHLEHRLVARSDSGCSPILRIDCSEDPQTGSLSGVLQVSRIRAIDHHNNAVEYKDLIYQMYCVRDHLGEAEPH